MFLRYHSITKIVVAVMFVAFAASTTQAGLIGLWRFEGDAADTSANSNNGTLVDGASLVSDVPPGQGGQSLFVDGGTQHVLVPHDASLDITQAMTIAAWVKPVGNVGWDGVLGKTPSDGSGANHAGNYELRIENGGRFLNLLYQQGGADDTTGVTTNGVADIPAGEWTHVAVTADGATAKANFYVNGALVLADAAMPGSFGATNTNPLYIGSRADLFTAMNGMIDDVAIYNEVLSASRVNDAMNGVFVPEPSTWILAGIGALGLAVIARRRRG